MLFYFLFMVIFLGLFFLFVIYFLIMIIFLMCSLMSYKDNPYSVVDKAGHVDKYRYTLLSNHQAIPLGQIAEVARVTLRTLARRTTSN